MRKKVSYSLKIILDNAGEVRNSLCECPGGMGPHATCKHIVALLLVIIEFKKSGTINISKSCTEELQSFHKPKKSHSGSPVKAEHLARQIQDDPDDDPRPVHLRKREQYSNEVMMKVINFACNTGVDVAYRHMGTRANCSAAAKDHDYLDRDFRTY